jgi:hypothetical protein
LPLISQAWQNIDFLQPLPLLMRTVSCVLGEWKERTRKAVAKDPGTAGIETLAPNVLGVALRADACDPIASRAAVRALLASEAGRAARAAVAQQRRPKAPRVFRICIRNLAMPNV